MQSASRKKAPRLRLPAIALEDTRAAYLRALYRLDLRHADLLALADSTSRRVAAAEALRVLARAHEPILQTLIHDVLDDRVAEPLQHVPNAIGVWSAIDALREARKQLRMNRILLLGGTVPPIDSWITVTDAIDCSLQRVERLLGERPKPAAPPVVGRRSTRKASSDGVAGVQAA